MMAGDHKYIWKHLSTAAAVLGSLLAAYLWLLDRSVFLDEANLIRNIYERSYFELLQPLDYDQSAPFLFTWGGKFLIDIFGKSTMAFRIFPLFLVLASIWLLWRLANRFFAWPAALYVTGLYSLHMLVLRYAGEFKQYGGDLFAAILLLYLYYTYKPNSWTKAIVWALVGSLMIWLSMPSVFMLAGIGIAWLVEMAMQHRDEKMSGPQLNNVSTLLINNIPKMVVVAFIWLAAVAGNYYFILAPGLASGHMQNYHAQYFLDITSLESVQKSLMAFIRLIAKKSAVGIAVAVILLLTGIWSIRKKAELIVLLLPILLAMLFSTLEMYSLLERLILFALPLLLMLAGYGISYMMDIQVRPILKITLLLIILVGTAIAFSNRQGTKLISSHPMEDLKTALLLMPSEITNPIFISRHAYPTYHHYTEVDKLLPQSKYIHGNELSNIAKEIKFKMKADEFWIILSHIDNLEEEKSQITDSFDILNIIESKGSVIYLANTKP